LKRLLAYITLLFLLFPEGLAQSPRFYLGFDEIMDNREYSSPYVHPQTIFGARINPGVSFGFDSLHSVNLGINYMYEFGGELFGVSPQLDLYYSYRSETFNLRFGSFPRKDILDYPLMLLTDTLNYYRPNMEGASVFYAWQWGSVHAWVDWTGRITPENRESILAGFDASLHAGVFYLTTITTRYHLARLAVYDPTNHLRDDGSLLAIAGADLAAKVPLDELDISTGWVSTYLWNRPSDPVWTGGWLTQLDARWGIFGLKGTCYLGEAPNLAYGDPLYRSGNYGRFDFFVDPFKNPRISSKIGWNIHMISGEGIRHSQQILISVML
jgi:hypothetical protein